MATAGFRIAAVVTLIGATLTGEAMVVSASRSFQHLNTDILGSSTDDSVRPLRRWRIGEVRPSEVSLQVSSNRYTGATLTFPKELTVEEAVHSIESAFMQCKAESGQAERRVWTEPESGFTIRLSVETNFYRVTYDGSKPPRKTSIRDGQNPDQPFSLTTT